MPLIQIGVRDKAFTPRQNQEIVRKPKDLLVSMEGEQMRANTSVAIEEICRSESASGEQETTTETEHAAVASFFGRGCF